MEAHFNAPDRAQSTRQLLESCLRRFERVTVNYFVLGYSTQTVTALILKLWLRRWSSPDYFAVLRTVRNTARARAP